MLLKIAVDKKGNLIAGVLPGIIPLNSNDYKAVGLDVSASTLKALRKKCKTEISVMEAVVEKLYPNNPTLVEYVEGFDEIRFRVFESIPPSKVLIGVKGGLVQWIQSNSPTDTLTLDMDVENGDEKNVMWIDIDNRVGDACASHTQATVNPEFVERVYQQVLPQLD